MMVALIFAGALQAGLAWHMLALAENRLGEPSGVSSVLSRLNFGLAIMCGVYILATVMAR
jgi:hypothetical protein